MFYFRECVQNVIVLKGHLLLYVNQEVGKQDALAILNEKSCLIVMNRAMEFLPHH